MCFAVKWHQSEAKDQKTMDLTTSSFVPLTNVLIPRIYE